MEICLAHFDLLVQFDQQFDLVSLRVNISSKRCSSLVSQVIAQCRECELPEISSHLLWSCREQTQYKQGPLSR